MKCSKQYLNRWELIKNKRQEQELIQHKLDLKKTYK
jgi:hypothetical protein